MEDSTIGTAVASAVGIVASVLLLWATAFLTLTVGFLLGDAWPPDDVHVANGDTSITQMVFLAVVWLASLLAVTRLTRAVAIGVRASERIAVGVTLSLFAAVSVVLAYTLYTFVA